MNQLKTLGLAAALAAAATPVAAGTVTERSALEACANAAVTELPGIGNDALSVRLDPASQSSDRRLTRSGVFHLDVRDPESRDVLARVDCHFTRRAEIRRLVSVPLSAEDAGNRALKPF
ncbi:MAG: hypothetical protein HKP03_06485 [Xanthomonadales bacterium]|nr:hypothetical protein [Gammaproteobacteria bacterium]MBT8063556.1 hypothetical protein [Gammaproteobacteria bacterium]NNK33109.1 hypothetical protein [Xanthomonadales bacterium]NNK38110.1 hypothetical protein [Xanthomonadales bacterium]